MSKKCQLTGRIPRKGRTYVTRGIAKKQKGIGLNITGKSKRRFLPNLKKKRFWFGDENRFVSLKVSCAAMRTIEKRGMTKIVKELRSKHQKV